MILIQIAASLKFVKKDTRVFVPQLVRKAVTRHTTAVATMSIVHQKVAALTIVKKQELLKIMIITGGTQLHAVKGIYVMASARLVYVKQTFYIVFCCSTYLFLLHKVIRFEYILFECLY